MFISERKSKPSEACINRMALHQRGVCNMKLKSLKSKLILLLFGIILISNGILGFIAYSMSKMALEDSVEQVVTATAEKVAVAIKESINTEFRMLEAMAENPALSRDDISLDEKCTTVRSATKIDSIYENIAFYDKNGNTVMDSGELLNFADREYFKSAMSGSHYLSDPTISPLNGKLLVFFAVPVKEKTRIKSSACLSRSLTAKNSRTFARKSQSVRKAIRLSST